MTPRRIEAVALAFAALLFAVGCGVDCEGLCEERKKCDGEDKAVDCADYCEETAELVEKANCEDQYDELTQCTGGEDDVCRPDADSCRAESVAYTDCMTKYCVDHAADCK
jgi:hypothetical protein